MFERKYPVAQPKLFGNEKIYVNKCLDSGWISSTGEFLDRFESEFSSICNAKYVVATNNGTTALHLAMVALNLKPNDEVIVPTFTYIATANAVNYCGAKVRLVDVKKDGTINPDEIEKVINSKTVGIIAVHLYGVPAEMSKLKKIAHENNLWLVEDAAEAHGANVDGNKVGGIGDIGVFSFFGNKIIATGEGGALVTNNPELAARARFLRNQGMDPERRYYFPEVGYNYRMTNITAAIGVSQIENFELNLSKRRRIQNTYNEIFAGSPFITPHILENQSNTVCWLYSIIISGGAKNRNSIMKNLEAVGIETRPFFIPLHKMPPYMDDKTFPQAEFLGDSGMNLPTYYDLSEDDVKTIGNAVIKATSYL